MTTTTLQHHHRLIILYGIGGLSDVGRHAVEVAHDLMLPKAGATDDATVTVPPMGQDSSEQAGEGSSSARTSKAYIGEILVMTKFPDQLFESFWKCGCPEPHRLDANQFTVVGSENSSANADPRLRIVKVTDWKDAELRGHFAPRTAGTGSSSPTTTSVISCLGNRQTVGHNDAAEAMELLILPAMQKYRIERLVCITSVGVEEDWPPFEFDPVIKRIMSCLLLTFMRRAFRDLTRMERLVRAAPSSSLDYLLVRPVGITEHIVPQSRWQIQKQKHRDKLGIEMAKLDVARFMVLQCLQPTLHRAAIVIGGVIDESAAHVWDAASV
jgi:hypothetical protein